MAWTTRQPPDNLLTLGGKQGNIQQLGGLLAAIVPNTNPKFRNPTYEIIKKSGQRVALAGATTLTNQIGPDDVGRFIKLRYLGMAAGPNGQYKRIEVVVWEGPPTPEMAEWPGYAELQAQLADRTPEPGDATADEFDDFPAVAPEAPSDDLPF
jgi:hypothetical protein